jgi:DNA-binding winged helix-turn-helix (wHTH) protein
MRTDQMIVDEALNILGKKFDPLEIQRFIVTVNRKGFDYTLWRKNLKEEGETLESLSHKAQKHYETNIATDPFSSTVVEPSCSWPEIGGQ